MVAVPNSFAKEWIAKYYLDVLQRAVDSILGADREVVLVEQSLTHPDQAPSTYVLASAKG